MQHIGSMNQVRVRSERGVEGGNQCLKPTVAGGLAWGYGGQDGIPVSGIAKRLFSVATLNLAGTERPTPPPMTIPSMKATYLFPSRAGHNKQTDEQYTANIILPEVE